MKRLSIEAEQRMKERFGKDSVIALATEENGIPYVRYVNAYYEDESPLYVRVMAIGRPGSFRESRLQVQLLLRARSWSFRKRRRSQGDSG